MVPMTDAEMALFKARIVTVFTVPPQDNTDPLYDFSSNRIPDCQGICNRERAVFATYGKFVECNIKEAFEETVYFDQGNFAVRLGLHPLVHITVSNNLLESFLVC